MLQRYISILKSLLVKLLSICTSCNPCILLLLYNITSRCLRAAATGAGCVPPVSVKHFSTTVMLKDSCSSLVALEMVALIAFILAAQIFTVLTICSFW